MARLLVNLIVLTMLALALAWLLEPVFQLARPFTQKLMHSFDAQTSMRYTLHMLRLLRVATV